MIKSIQNAEIIVYDFDGVMTDNTAYLFEDGREAVRVNRADGLGVKIIKELGYHQIILSTETNKVVKSRAKKLNIDCIQNVSDKASSLKKICANNNISLEKTIYIGNDINDEEAMRLVGYPIAPSDANTKIKEISVLVLNSKGGHGVVRELAEIILNNKTYKKEIKHDK